MSDPRRHDDNDHVRHLTICLPDGGGVACYPSGEMTADHVRRIAQLVDVLHREPERIACVLGVCGGDASGEGGHHVH